MLTIDALRSMIDVNAAIDDRVNVPLIPTGFGVLFHLPNDFKLTLIVFEKIYFL